MFDKTPELSPDLEWMLLSGQSGDEILVGALVDEYFAQAYRLALSCLDDARMATAAAQEAFARAALELHRFPAYTGPRTWLFSLVLDACRKPARWGKARSHLADRPPGVEVPSAANPAEAGLWRSLDSLPLDQKIPFILQAVHDLDGLEIAHLLGSNPAAVGERIAAAVQALELAIHHHPPHLSPIDTEDGQRWLVASLASRWPQPDLSSHALQPYKHRILALVRRQRTRRRLFARLQELALVGLAICAVVVFVGLGNLVLAGDDTLNPDLNPHSSDRRAAQVSAPGEGRPGSPGGITTPASPPTSTATTPRQPPYLLTLHSSSEQVARRIAESHLYWRSLWADVQVYFYGPPGYLGPPQAHRHQVWIERDQAGVWLSGPLGGHPESVSLLAAGMRGPASPVHNLWALERLGNHVPWFVLSADRLPDSPFLVQSQRISGLRSLRQATFQVLETALVAGREAVLVAQYGPDASRFAHLLVDSATGLILGERHFAADSGQLVLIDSLVTAIAYEVDFPDGFFRPDRIASLQEGFAAGYRAETRDPSALERLPPIENLAARQPPVRSPPPPGHDPSLSRLAFHWPTSQPGTYGDYAEIFAGHVSLGKARLGDPFSLLCQRSPDGSVVAFASHPDHSEPSGRSLAWLHLPGASDLHTPEAVFDVHRLLFSPDGRWLAVSASWISGPDDLTHRSGILVFDTRSAEPVRAYPIRAGHLLGWHPDGEYLAVLRWFKRLKERFEVHALRLQDGEFIPGQGEFLVTQRVSFHIPELGWEDEFALEPAGLEACVGPPQSGSRSFHP